MLTKTIKNKTYEQSDELEQLAKMVSEKETALLNNDGAVIKYMKVYPNISPTIAGRCIKSSPAVKFFGDCDYIIQMSGDLWDALSENSRYVLMLHELMHVYVDIDKKGNNVFKLRKHDVEDFAVLIEQYGIDWLYALRDTASGVDSKVDVTKIRL